jgi:transcriptional regulator with XRE-family HTH domain
MAHEKLNFKISHGWTRAHAKLEPDSGITSAGGLAHRLRAAGRPGAVVISTDPRRQSLGKLIELSRRRMRLSVEQLADRANVDLAELLGIEKAEDTVPELRTIYQLAGVLGIGPDPLLELAGLIEAKFVGLGESAVRFAARSEPMNALTKEEEEALNWFVAELTKG